MHRAAYEWVDKQVKEHGPFASVVEIGSRWINGGVKHLFDGAAYVGIDVLPGPGVDLVADGVDYQPADPVAGVVCCEVLEHTLKAEEIVANACRMLAPGGWLILTAAGPGRAPHSAVDGNELREGEVYQNVDPALLLAWLTTMESVIIEQNRAAGDVYAVARQP